MRDAKRRGNLPDAPVARSPRVFDRFLGLSIDGLSLPDRVKLTGLWIALELYSPDRLPLRIVQAVGHSPAACIAQLRSRGLDPTRYEFEAVDVPFQPPSNI